MLHVTSLSLKWRVTSAVAPPPSIGLRFRVSPYEDGGTNPCFTYACDPELGPQVCTPAPVGTLCSDGNVCNGTETCDGEGACAPGTLLPNGTSCSDENVCNGEERCNQGTCVAGRPLSADDVNDRNPCTEDSCDPLQGVVNALRPGCQTTANAPPIPLTESQSFAAATNFLFSGSSPVQTGVAAGTIEEARSAVARGRVLATDGVSPLSGAVVTILQHPELGQTLSRSDGYYDLAVNGGGPLTVNIAAPGALPIQRTAPVAMHGFAVLPDVVVSAPDTSADTFTPGLASGQLVRGKATSAGTDADGARGATLYFPPNTTITNFAPGPGPLAVEITEYTGANGPQRMPGALPPTSGYTYAVEAAIPAARAAGVAHPTFSRNVALYVDNFTQYPVGQPVPLGAYDEARGVWVAEPSGRILKVIGATAGLANLDVTGDGVPDDAATLAALGIDESERAAIATEFVAGRVLWRSSLAHFSAWDCNWGFGPPIGARPPPPPRDPGGGNPDCQSLRSGSIIGCEFQTLGETLPLVGTPFALNFDTSRTPGYRSELRIQYTDATSLPSSLLRAHIDVDVAGRHFAYERPAPLALLRDVQPERAAA